MTLSARAAAIRLSKSCVFCAVVVALWMPFTFIFFCCCLAFVADVNWDNVFCAGGSVLACLLHPPTEYNVDNKTRRDYFHNVAYAGSDVDLFLYGLTEVSSRPASVPHSIGACCLRWRGVRCGPLSAFATSVCCWHVRQHAAWPLGGFWLFCTPWCRGGPIAGGE